MTGSICSSSVWENNEDIVKVHEHKDIQHATEDVIDQSLEYGKGIGETKGHDKVLVEAVENTECCLPLITLTDLDKMIRIAK